MKLFTTSALMEILFFIYSLIFNIATPLPKVNNQVFQINYAATQKKSLVILHSVHESSIIIWPSCHNFSLTSKTAQMQQKDGELNGKIFLIFQCSVKFQHIDAKLVLWGFLGTLTMDINPNLADQVLVKSKNSG